MEKLAIVTSGGGMTCSYSVGVILALVEKYNLTKPDIVIGCSGSTGTLAYYVSGQYRSIKNIWENLLSTNKFISFKRLKPIIDIDYLIDEVFKKKDVLNINSIMESPIDFYIAVTDQKSGKCKFYSNRDGHDIFELLRASSAMPVFFGKSVNIKGREYIDGAVSSNLETSIEFAKQLGATKLIVINNTSRNKLLYLYSLITNRKLRKSIQNNNLVMEHNKSMLLIEPSKTLPISILDNKQEHIKETIKLGYNDLMNNEALKSFLSF